MKCALFYFRIEPIQPVSPPVLIVGTENPIGVGATLAQICFACRSQSFAAFPQFRQNRAAIVPPMPGMRSDNHSDPAISRHHDLHTPPMIVIVIVVGLNGPQDALHGAGMIMQIDGEQENGAFEAIEQLFVLAFQGLKDGVAFCEACMVVRISPLVPRHPRCHPGTSSRR